MKSPENLFVDSEHEYQVAGWLGTIAIMSILATGPRPRRILKGHDEFLFDFCKNIAGGENIHQKIGHWVANKDKNEERIGALNQACIMSGNSLDEDFEFAYDIFADEEWHDLIVKETSFGRLYPIVQELVEYYAPSNIPVGLPHSIVTKQRDISFYVGHYDSGF